MTSLVLRNTRFAVVDLDREPVYIRVYETGRLLRKAHKHIATYSVNKADMDKESVEWARLEPAPRAA